MIAYTSVYGNTKKAVLQLAEKLATNGCLGFWDDEKFKLICSYMKKVHIDGGFFVNFADAHPTESMGSFPMIYGFARETEQPEMMNFSAAIYNESSSASVLYDQCFRRVFFMHSFIKDMRKHESALQLHGELEVCQKNAIGLLCATSYAPAHLMQL